MNLQTMLEMGLGWIRDLPFVSAVLLFLLENVVQLVVTVLIGDALVKLFHRNRIAQIPEPVSSFEMLLVISSLLLNTLITLVGWWLWRANLIRIRGSSDAWGVLLDVFVLIVVMDFFMYLLHRVAHHRLIYPFAHRTHHIFENPRPMTLFALNPLEVLGFGGLWLAVLIIYPASILGIVVYLSFNLAFGLVGHLGVEPAPWLMKTPGLRYLMTSSFHAGHHHDGAHNFGFYTLVWDKFFGTLEVNYFSKPQNLG
jgi:sterol desaturase/sphingolipid hydroxylase (fatty acid hydroxylase superfamily)